MILVDYMGRLAIIILFLAAVSGCQSAAFLDAPKNSVLAIGESPLALGLSKQPKESHKSFITQSVSLTKVATLAKAMLKTICRKISTITWNRSDS